MRSPPSDSAGQVRIVDFLGDRVRQRQADRQKQQQSLTAEGVGAELRRLATTIRVDSCTAADGPEPEVKLHDIAQTLDGSKIEKTTSGWSGFFDGNIAAQVLVDHNDQLLELTIPTSEHDINDYVWKSEIDGDSTDKIVLVDSNGPVKKQRVRSIERIGMRSNGQDAYRIVFEVDADDIEGDVGLEFRFGSESLAHAGNSRTAARRRKQDSRG